jgi:hypothetical protein
LRNQDSKFIGISAGTVQVDTLSANFSSYNGSKLAAVKVLEVLGKEYPDLYVVSMHPGVGTFTT